MKRTRIVLLAVSLAVSLTVGLVVVGLAGAASAEDSGGRGFGARPSHVSDEAYDLELGLTVSGRAGLPVRHRDVRNVIVVPAHYGDLFQITQDGRDSVLWYRAADGTIRNAFLDGTSVTAYQVERVEATRLDVKVR